MKSNNKNIVQLIFGIWIILCLIISSYIFSGQMSLKLSSEGFKESQLPISSAVYIEPYIHINEIDPNLDWNKTATDNPWCSGAGNWSDPYIIENVVINATNSPIGCGILIELSWNKYFIIRNCTIFNSATPYENPGIILYWTNNGTLIENNCSNNRIGIKLFNSKNCTLIGNTANSNALDGIRSEASSTTYSDNIIGNNQKKGLNITLGNHNIITGNTINGNKIGGLFLKECNDTTISANTANDNICHDEYIGYPDFIYLYSIAGSSSRNIFISGNTINDNFSNSTDNIHGALYLDSCNETIISGNTIESNLAGINIDSTTFGTKIVNIEVSGNTIRNNIVGISISGDYVSGEYLMENCIIKQNTIDSNENGGIDVNVAANINISDNTLSSNGHALGSSPRHSITISFLNNSQIIGNTIQNSGDNGFYISYMNYSTISDNIIEKATKGIDLTCCDHNMITGNQINDCSGVGINLCNSSYNTVTGNIIRNCSECIKEEGNCYGNTIENNDCGDEIPGYNILILFAMIGIVSTIILKKWSKK